MRRILRKIGVFLFPWIFCPCGGLHSIVRERHEVDCWDECTKCHMQSSW